MTLDLPPILKPIIGMFAIATGISMIPLIIKLAVKKAVQHHRFKKTKDIHALTPRDFVSYVAYAFQSQGYNTKITEGLNDKGADLVLKKDGVVTVVQVKHWRKPVGINAVREVVAAMPCYNATKSIVVCSGQFTQKAVELAKHNRVRLIDGPRLVSLAQKSQGSSPPLTQP